MASYRMYFLASARIEGRQDFDADEDIAAIRIAGDVARCVFGHLPVLRAMARNPPNPRATDGSFQSKLRRID